MTKARDCIAMARGLGLTISVAESCTGGLLGGALTAVSGSSSIFEGGAITYSNKLKMRLLDVDPTLFASVGAVSEEVAKAMASGACQSFDTDVAVSVTGIAGPRGGSRAKPVGTVYIGVAIEGELQAFHHHFTGLDRHGVREASVEAALGHLHDVLEAQARDLG